MTKIECRGCANIFEFDEASKGRLVDRENRSRLGYLKGCIIFLVGCPECGSYKVQKVNRPRKVLRM